MSTVSSTRRPRVRTLAPAHPDSIEAAAERPVLGLHANRRQFWLLVLVNAFVGSVVGLERTVLPLLAEAEFGLASRTAALSFIATFGAWKVGANFFAGRLVDVFGRRPVLIAGWVFGVPVPFLVIFAPAWEWIVFANVLLGLNQGLAWSTTIIMKIDLVGPHRRGLAMGLNEFAGYLAVALAALGTGVLAQAYGLRPEPFYVGIAVVAAGLALSLLFVRETRAHVEVEAESLSAEGDVVPDDPGSWEMLRLGSWRDPALSTASHTGLVNNLNDGLAWGLFPLFFAAAGLDLRQIGVLSFAYPATWGLLQLWTGALSDRWGRRWLIAAGMGVQAAALLGIAAFSSFAAWCAAVVLLGAGTAMVYPTLLAVAGDVAHPRWRGSAVGVYRVWRDSGYVVGALLAGALADLFGMASAIAVIGVLTAAAGVWVVLRLPETLRITARRAP